MQQRNVAKSTQRTVLRLQPLPGAITRPNPAVSPQPVALGPKVYKMAAVGRFVLSFCNAHFEQQSASVHSQEVYLGRARLCIPGDDEEKVAEVAEDCVLDW